MTSQPYGVPPLGEGIIRDDLHYYLVSHPAAGALFTKTGAPVRLAQASEDITVRSNPVAVFPTPTPLTFRRSEWECAHCASGGGGGDAKVQFHKCAHRVAVGRTKGAKQRVMLAVPQRPIGYEPVVTDAQSHIFECLGGMAAGDHGMPEGGAVLSVARGLLGLSILRDGPVCGVDAVERKQTCAEIAAANGTDVPNHLCVLHGRVKAADATWRPCPRERRPTCAAVAAWQGDALEDHVCVRDGAVPVERAARAQCPHGVLSADSVGPAHQKVFITMACMHFWFAVRRRWFYNARTDHYVVTSSSYDLQVDESAVYVYLAAALRYEIVDPDARGDARVENLSEDLRTHMRAVRACVSASPPPPGMASLSVRLDCEAAARLSLHSFVVFVCERLSLASKHEPLADGRFPWIGAAPRRALAPGRTYSPVHAFFPESTWGTGAVRSSKDYFSQRGWAPCGVAADIQRLSTSVRASDEELKPANLFKYGDFGVRLLGGAVWYLEHCWCVPTQPLVCLHDPLRRGRVIITRHLVHTAPPEETAAVRVWTALFAFMMSTTDAATCGQHLNRTRVGQGARETARAVAVRKRPAISIAATAAKAGSAAAAAAAAASEPVYKRARTTSRRNAVTVPVVDTGANRVLGGCTTHTNLLHYGFQLLRSDTQPTHASTRFAVVRHVRNRKQQGTEFVILPPASRPRLVDTPIQRVLRTNLYHPLEQNPVRIIHAWLESGILDGIRSITQLPRLSDSDRIELGGGGRRVPPPPSNERFAVQMPLPATLRRLHGIMWAAVERERAGARMMLGERYNFLCSDNPDSLVFAYTLALRANMSASEAYLLLLFYTWVAATAPVLRWTTPCTPHDNDGGNDDDDDWYRVRRAAGAATVREVVSDEDDADVPRPLAGDTAPNIARRRCVIPACIRAVLPTDATMFVPTPATVTALLRRMARAWDGDVVGAFGGATYDTSSPLRRFVKEFIEEPSYAALSTFALRVMTRARFPLDASRQYGPAMDRLAKDVARRYVTRPNVVRTVLRIHGADLHARSGPVCLDDIDIPSPASFANGKATVDWSGGTNMALYEMNAQLEAMRPEISDAEARIATRDAHVRTVSSAVLACLLDGEGGIQQDPLERRAGSGVTRDSTTSFTVRLRSTGADVPIACVSHWVLHGVVRPVMHLILWLLHPPVAPPIPVDVGAPSPPHEVETVFTVTTSRGDRVRAQRTWWPNTAFESPERAVLHSAGVKIQSIVDATRNCYEFGAPGCSVAESTEAATRTAHAMVECAHNDSTARIAVFALATGDTHRSGDVGGGGAGRSSASKMSAATQRAWDLTQRLVRAELIGSGALQIGDRAPQMMIAGSEAAAATPDTSAASMRRYGGSRMAGVRTDADLQAWVRCAVMRAMSDEKTGTVNTEECARVNALVFLLQHLGYTGTATAASTEPAPIRNLVRIGLHGCAAVLGAVDVEPKVDAASWHSHYIIASRIVWVLATVWNVPQMAPAARDALRSVIDALLAGCVDGAAQRANSPRSSGNAALQWAGAPASARPLLYPEKPTRRSSLTLALVLFARTYLVYAYKVAFEDFDTALLESAPRLVLPRAPSPMPPPPPAIVTPRSPPLQGRHPPLASCSSSAALRQGDVVEQKLSDLCAIAARAIGIHPPDHRSKDPPLPVMMVSSSATAAAAASNADIISLMEELGVEIK